MIWGYVLAFLSWSYSICNSYSLITGFYAAAFFFFNIHTKSQILLYFTCFFHAYAWIPPVLHYWNIYFFNLDLQLCCFLGLMYIVWNVTSLPLFLLLFFFFWSPCWLFYGGFWKSRGHLTGSSLQWDHKHCRKICPLLQHCFSSPWLSSHGIPFWQ